MPILSNNTLAWIQAGSWLAAIAAGIFGIAKIVIELRRSREQREDDLRWRKAQAAKSLNDEMLTHRGAQVAMTMLDWDGRTYDIGAEKPVRIATADVLSALRVENLTFTVEETFIRDAFDNLFYYFALFQHYTDRGLVDFADISYPADYYVGLLSKNRGVFDRYLERYGFNRAKAFLDRFDAWTAAITASAVRDRTSSGSIRSDILAPAGN